MKMKKYIVKRGYYKNGHKLLRQLDTNYFSYDPLTNRFSIKPGGNTIILDASLASILGFKEESHSKDCIAQHSPHFKRGIYNVFCYLNICESVRVGNILAPLLRTVNFKRGSFGETVNIIYNNPIFTKVSKSFIDSIQVMLLDDMGRDIPFKEGKTIVTLQFRRS